MMKAQIIIPGMQKPSGSWYAFPQVFSIIAACTVPRVGTSQSNSEKYNGRLKGGK